MSNELHARAESLFRYIDGFAPSYEDRKNLAASFASVIDTKALQARQRIPSFQELLDNLGIKPEDRVLLLKMAFHVRQDPVKFVLAIREQNARNQAFWNLLYFIVKSGCYDAQDRESIRMLALAINEPWSRVLQTEAAMAQQLLNLMKSSPASLPEMDRHSEGRFWKIAAASQRGGNQHRSLDKPAWSHGRRRFRPKGGHPDS